MKYLLIMLVNNFKPYDNKNNKNTGKFKHDDNEKNEINNSLMMNYKNSRNINLIK